MISVKVCCVVLLSLLVLCGCQDDEFSRVEKRARSNHEAFHAGRMEDELLRSLKDKIGTELFEDLNDSLDYVYIFEENCRLRRMTPLCMEIKEHVKKSEIDFISGVALSKKDEFIKKIGCNGYDAFMLKLSSGVRKKEDAVELTKVVYHVLVGTARPSWLPENTYDCEVDDADIDNSDVEAVVANNVPALSLSPAQSNQNWEVCKRFDPMLPGGDVVNPDYDPRGVVPEVELQDYINCGRYYYESPMEYDDEPDYKLQFDFCARVYERRIVTKEAYDLCIHPYRQDVGAVDLLPSGRTD